MSSRTPLLHLQRFGGSAPPDDEELIVSDDGTFSARRTIGGPRIGTFSGRIADEQFVGLTKAVDAAARAGNVQVQTPGDGATETIEVVGATIELGSNEQPPKPWTDVVERARSLLRQDVLDSPHAALKLIADARTARLEHAGDGALDVDLGSVLVTVIRVADQGGVLGRWNGRPAGSLVDNGETLNPTPRWVTAAPGWRASLPFDHHLELASGDMLQVWVDVPIRDGDRARDGRLYVPVLADG